MPARDLYPQPLQYLVSGEWPDGRLARTAPSEARLIAAVARRLRDACGQRSLRDVAGATGVSASTLSNLLGGRSWGDVVTVARLESALGVNLWGDEHRIGHPHDAKTRSGRTGPARSESGPPDLPRRRKAAQR
ncbi:MAG: helix-turn-helix transcriptional regulator [Actinomycetota bacterium]|nr:helix-turn-helix transcriptional regulator [Actinomycetota bacterium]